VIEVRDAKKWIQNGARRVEILRGISLVIPAGQFVAIVGASGSGKSTLLGLLAGLDTPSSGEIWLDGVPIHNLAEAELAEVRGKKIGFVFQSYQLIATLTALENVLLPYELNLEGSGLGQARRLLDEVGLKERVDHYPVQLSGGEQQRVALARAFVVEPPIVMADEPTGNLDSANGRLVLDLLLERNRKAGTTLVLVTHDPEVASRADRKIVLRDGMVVEDSLPFTGPLTGEGPTAQEAKDGQISSEDTEGQTSGAKAPVDSAHLIVGVKTPTYQSHVDSGWVNVRAEARTLQGCCGPFGLRLCSRAGAEWLSGR
jgi:putative ABC transport system ATP-binding protein